MTKPEEPEPFLVQITTVFETTCFVSFAAPYGLDEKVKLPVGLILKIRENQARKDSHRFTAKPVNSQGWAPFILSDSHRFDKNFRGDYDFNLSMEEINTYGEKLKEMPAELSPQEQFIRAAHGSLFGTALGDSIGLPFEGLSARRIAKFAKQPLKQRFLFGNGMLSDDTEHSCITAQAIIIAADDIVEFTSNMCWSLRFWFLGLPAGIGMATLKSCLKLWFFRSARKSGVFSAGNGPAMRSAIVGVYAFDDRELRNTLLEINTQITHTDPKALKGAKIVAEMAARNTAGTPVTCDNCFDSLSSIIDGDEELTALVSSAIESASRGQSALEFCQKTGQKKGVGGYIYYTLPVVVQIVLRHNNDFEAAITEAVLAGGDTDTVAAIVGGIVGANTGVEGMPHDWLDNLKDWPRNNRYLRLIADELALVKWTKKPGRTQWMDPVRLWIRNAFFMIWVLVHGFRRLLPPY